MLNKHFEALWTLDTEIFVNFEKLTKLKEPKRTFSSTLVDQLPHPVRNVEQKWPAWKERHVQCQPYNLQRHRSSSSSQCRGKSKVNCLFLQWFRSNFSIALPTAWNVTCATALLTHEDVVHNTDFFNVQRGIFPLHWHWRTLPLYIYESKRESWSNLSRSLHNFNQEEKTVCITLAI